MKRLMDTFIRGYLYCRQGIRLVGTLPGIIWKGATAGQDFQIRVTPDGKLYFQKTNDSNPISNYFYLDWATGQTVFTSISVKSGTVPTPIQGGIYFNTSTSKWYKCEDGVNWVLANI